MDITFCHALNHVMIILNQRNNIEKIKSLDNENHQKLAACGVVVQMFETLGIKLDFFKLMSEVERWAI